MQSIQSVNGSFFSLIRSIAKILRFRFLPQFTASSLIAKCTILPLNHLPRSRLSSHQADLAALYQKSGLKNVGTVFLMTDSQVAEEKFLVLINDLLASGEIPDLFPDDEVENIIGAVRNEVGAYW